jgi:GxxExxY protein
MTKVNPGIQIIVIVYNCESVNITRFFNKVMPLNHESTKSNKKTFTPIPQELEIIGKHIVDSAYTVHKALGPGLLEKVYEACFCHELLKRDVAYSRQIEIPIVYDGLTFDEGLRLDVLVENSIICELKAVDLVNPVWEAQILSQLKLTNKRLGYLINFNVVNIGSGIKRFAL